MGRSEMRSAHIHFIVAAPGHESVTTHLFVEGDPYLASDAVFGVKETLIAPFTKCDDPGQAADLQIGTPFYLLEWDFVLARTGDACKILQRLTRSFDRLGPTTRSRAR
jgi:catechol 1,2-dioxygenase